MIDALPFEIPSANVPFVVLEARVNSTRARVLLDTGAAAPFVALLSPGLAQRAGLVVSNAPSVPSSGAVGQEQVGFTPAKLARFQLGPIKLTGVNVGVTAALDAISRQIGYTIDAIVGQEFIRGRVVSIDYRLRQVDFTAAVGKKDASIPFTIAPKRALTLVKVSINRRGPFLMALDTAASSTLLSPATAKAAGVEASQSVGLAGAGGIDKGGAKLGAAEIGLGSFTRKRQNVAIADVLKPVELASGVALDGVLGADFLMAGKITIDYRTRSLWISGDEKN
jgi:predicted aspartyl protease